MNPGRRTIWLWSLLLIVLAAQGCSTKVGVFYRDIFDKKELSSEAKESEETYILKVPFLKQTREDCCGLTVLAMVARYWREDQDQVELLATACPEKGFSGKDLLALAVAQGFKGLIYKGSLPDLFKHLTATRPLIVLLDRYGLLHYVVVVGYAQDGRIALHDPAEGPVVYDIQFFLDLWKRAKYFTLLIVPKE
jgi:ABC-type bacteriocin/lantibiotic exporter with double-glycine peptidase domain